MSSVDHPRHYNAGGVEVIDAIEAWGLGFHDGNVVKYIARAPHKGSEVEDLEKALWYLARKLMISGVDTSRIVRLVEGAVGEVRESK